MQNEPQWKGRSGESRAAVAQGLSLKGLNLISPRPAKHRHSKRYNATYIIACDFILEQKIIHNRSAKLIWVQSMSPAYTEWDFFPRDYLTLMSDPIGGRQLLKHCGYPRDHFALIYINHVLRGNGRAGADWGFVMLGSAWVPALCQSRGSGGLGLYLCIQIKMKQDQTPSCLAWLSLSRVIFFSSLTRGIMLILLTVMSFTFTGVYVNSPWANVVYKMYQR